MRFHILAAVFRAGAVALMVLGGPFLPAADLQPLATKAEVVVLISPLQKQGEVFRQLIADAAQYKLGSLGVRSEVVTATAEQADNPLPKDSGARAALICKYAVKDGSMDMTMEWYDAGSNISSQVVRASGQLDLKLDNVILGALDQILSTVHDKIQAIPGYHAPDANLTTQRNLTSTGPGFTVITQPAAAAQVPSSSAHRLLFSGGFAPFLPTGAAAYYFSLGYLPSLLASVFIDTPVGPLGLGFYAAVDYFTAVGAQDYANTYLLPLGVDVRYELGNASLRPFFHLTGGPAIMFMVTGGQGTITSVLPFLKSGIGLRFAMTQTLGVGLLADYDVYFAMPYLLMGFSPSVNMELRL